MEVWIGRRWDFNFLVVQCNGCETRDVDSTCVRYVKASGQLVGDCSAEA